MSEEPEGKASGGSQTLIRGLDLIDAVKDGPINLTKLAAKLGLTRSTTHRLASALIDRRFLTMTPRLGYQLGPKLLELGFLAQQQTNIVQVSRPHLEALSAETEDTVHLGVRDGDKALYLDKIPGNRRVMISSRVGDRQALTSTGLGKALLLDLSERDWRPLFKKDHLYSARKERYEDWLQRMRSYVERGCSYDLEENEDQIRCVASPVRDASGQVVAAISVSSAAQYMADERMTALSEEVSDCARAISRELGWEGLDTRG